MNGTMSTLNLLEAYFVSQKSLRDFILTVEGQAYNLYCNKIQ